jgi:hypothetical protein
MMVLMKLRDIIWLLCLLILVQVGWMGWRLQQIKKRDLEAWQKQQERKQVQQGEIEEELAQVPEPAVEENLPQGARIWLEPAELETNGEFELQVRLLTQKDIQNIGLILFYPQDLLDLVSEDWSDEGGKAIWSGDLPDRLEESDPGSDQQITTIRFEPRVSTGRKEAVLEWDFTKESLLDCNAWDREGKDVLEEAVGAKINLQFPSTNLQ